LNGPLGSNAVFRAPWPAQPHLPPGLPRQISAVSPRSLPRSGFGGVQNTSVEELLVAHPRQVSAARAFTSPALYRRAPRAKVAA